MIPKWPAVWLLKHIYPHLYKDVITVILQYIDPLTCVMIHNAITAPMRPPLLTAYYTDDYLAQYTEMPFSLQMPSQNPMWLACEQGCVKIVKYLAQRWIVLPPHMLIAARRGHVDVLAWILTASENKNELVCIEHALMYLNQTIDAGIRDRGGDPVRMRPRDPILQWVIDNGYATHKIPNRGPGGMLGLLVTPPAPREYERKDVEAFCKETGEPMPAYLTMWYNLAPLNDRIDAIMAARYANARTDAY